MDRVTFYESSRLTIRLSDPYLLLGAVTVAIVAASAYAFFYLPSSILRAMVKLFLVPASLFIDNPQDGIGLLLAIIAYSMIPIGGTVVQTLAAMGGVCDTWLNFSMDCLYYSAIIMLLPVYFEVVHPLEGEEDFPRVSSIRVSFPWGGTEYEFEMDFGEMMTSLEVVRMAAAVFFYSLVGGVTTAAVLVSWLQLVQQATISHWLSIAAFCSLFLFAPRFVFPSLSFSIRKTVVFYLVSIATVHSLMVFDLIPMEVFDLISYADLFWTFQIVV